MTRSKAARGPEFGLRSLAPDPPRFYHAGRVLASRTRERFDLGRMGSLHAQYQSRLFLPRRRERSQLSGPSPRGCR
jgi:hypothetical protein